MKNKVYIVLLQYQDCLEYNELIIGLVTTSKEKAKNRLKTLVDIECRNSWIADHDDDDFDSFNITEDYFGARYDDKLTEIWIEEKEIEE